MVGRYRLFFNASNPSKYLFFNGKKAAQEYLNRRITYYGLQHETYHSTSGVANRYWDDTYSFDLAQLIKKLNKPFKPLTN
ncbi:hypothetical protein GCM10009001_07620 [Virgibacillus siamensis]|uniref:Uncharacterized protein n=1 Tax=Virgibacillus siamensis TaxID=480071 RepID=A0ABN1FMK5_9BACI